MKVRRGLVLGVGLALVCAAPANAQAPVIADDVTIAGVEVGGKTRDQAVAAVQAFFDRRMTIRLNGRTRTVAPTALGGRARVNTAVAAALAAADGAAVPLTVVVRARQLKRWVARLSRSFNRRPVNARPYLRNNLRPRVRDARPGRRLRRASSVYRLKSALRRHWRGPVDLPSKVVRPQVTRRKLGSIVVIRRGSRALYLYRGLASGRSRLLRVFRVAVGQPSYPTPLGRFRIIRKTKNPWWYPPDAGWASGASPIPPGPGNPLGTRWMGLSVGAVGIHGTYNSASIGGFASHGCIRMYLRDAERLFRRVRIGTTVFIVGA
jgi:lipoprotein-anchoring transpeptidase ErfK/SrfK